MKEVTPYVFSGYMYSQIIVQLMVYWCLQLRVFVSVMEDKDSCGKHQKITTRHFTGDCVAGGRVGRGGATPLVVREQGTAYRSLLPDYHDI